MIKKKQYITKISFFFYIKTNSYKGININMLIIKFPFPFLIILINYINSYVLYMYRLIDFKFNNLKLLTIN